MSVIAIMLFLVGFYISYTDIRYRIIPDYITIPLIFTGISHNLYMIYAGNYVSALLGIAGGLFTYLYIFLLFHFSASAAKDRDVLGGGDIKLFIGLGFWLGLHLIFFVIFFASLLSLVFTLIRYFLGRWIKWPLAPGQSTHEDPYPIPFGFYVFLAILLTLSGYCKLFTFMGGI